MSAYRLIPRSLYFINHHLSSLYIIYRFTEIPFIGINIAIVMGIKSSILCTKCTNAQFAAHKYHVGFQWYS